MPSLLSSANVYLDKLSMLRVISDKITNSGKKIKYQITKNNTSHVCYKLRLAVNWRRSSLIALVPVG